MKIRVRDARPRDIGLFRKLWIQYLNESIKAGALVTANDKTLATYEALFEHYVTGELPGIVLFVADKAVLVAGAPISSFDYTQPTAFGWGLYVETDARRQGVATEMVKVAKEKLKERGFTVVNFIVLNNEGGLEFATKIGGEAQSANFVGEL
jgi:GNAT superfamily N-acetyltransferase